jgi:hypothetical protein
LLAAVQGYFFTAPGTAASFEAMMRAADAPRELTEIDERTYARLDPLRPG